MIFTSFLIMLVMKQGKSFRIFNNFYRLYHGVWFDRVYLYCNVAIINLGESLYCYQCTSNQPGCGDELRWYHWSKSCPEEDDVCIKIIETKGGNISFAVITNIKYLIKNSSTAETLLTRDCLSSVKSIRTDFPADHYEGCRPATKDVKLGHYVNNSITQLDIHRTHYDSVTWCFCYFHHRCNNALMHNSNIFILIFLVLYSFIH